MTAVLPEAGSSEGLFINTGTFPFRSIIGSIQKTLQKVHKNQKFNRSNSLPLVVNSSPSKFNNVLPVPIPPVSKITPANPVDTPPSISQETTPVVVPSCNSLSPSLSSSSSSSSSPSLDLKPAGGRRKNRLRNRDWEELPIPFTAPWVVKRLGQGPIAEALTVLRSQMVASRQNEISEELVQAINTLEKSEAVAAVRALVGPKRFIRGNGGNQLAVPLILSTLDTVRQVKAKALVDSGCTGSCINRSFVKHHDIPTKRYPLPIAVYNADGSINKYGSITEYVRVRVKLQDHYELLELAVTALSSADVFLGHEWLKRHNPNIDWQEGTIEFDRCPDVCGHTPELVDPDASTNAEVEDEEDEIEEGDRVFAFDWDAYKRSGHKTPTASVRVISIEELPPYARDFADVFSAEEFDQLPERRPWDHAIELTPGFKPTDCKIYPLSRLEQVALDDFLKENLRTGRIRPSSSPMASPFFFIKKKDGSLRPIQDYRRLNAGTVKNKYPLPLIQELIDRTKQAKYFTKLEALNSRASRPLGNYSKSSWTL